MAKEVDGKRADSVGEQDITTPQKMRMEQPEHHQPEVSIAVQPAYLRQRRATRFRTISKQHHTGSKQHREEPHELHVKEDVTESPNPAIDPLLLTEGGRIHVGAERHRKRLDVHHQDAEQGETTQHIDAGDSFSLRNWNRLNHGTFLEWLIDALLRPVTRSCQRSSNISCSSTTMPDGGDHRL